jgi:hypothetical protein
MTNISIKTLMQPLSIAVCSAIAVFATLPATAQITSQATALQPRITAPIQNSSRVTLTGSRSPLARPALDSGAVPNTMKLQGISLVFSRTPAQQAALDALVAAQQNPASPLYHQWLNPDQFAAQFGVSDADIAAVESWLQSQGFSIDSVSRSHNRISFSGNAGLVASAFGAPLHYFKTPAYGNQPAATHFAPSADLSIPAALGSSILAITNLSDFRPHPHVKLRGPSGAQPQFTSSQTGSHFMTPGDVATIYDITPAYNAGFTGSNQSIAIVGQSYVPPTDISNFQTAVGIAGQTPTFVIVPDSGTPEIFSLDETESDLDLEYSSTIAKGAQIFFVYTGNNPNYGAFNSIVYAIDERISPIVSSSYGDCEADLGQSEYSTFNSSLQQAAAQGQTVLSASGDSGSSDCYPVDDATITTLAEEEALAVDFPASSQYVTGVGGTEFPAADVAAAATPGTATTYWSAAPTTDVISSALSYIPEEVWNDNLVSATNDPSDPLSAGGGGVSIFTARPTWQTGTIGGVAFPTIGAGFRLVPDVALDASNTDAPYAFCTSDTTAWESGQEASCNAGLRDSASQDLTLAGGTSFAAPIFAAMVALINQSQNSTGQGVINATLYPLAATSAYSTAFHDITSGNNECNLGVSLCGTGGQTSDYAATTGYDPASGLGSVDLDNLIKAWATVAPTNPAAALTTTTTTLTAATTIPAVSAADTVTITVAEYNPQAPAIMIPTGSVSVTVDGVVVNSSLGLTSGVATYSFSSATTGSHVIVATYSGDANNAPSTGTIVLSVGGTSGTSATVTLAAGNITLAQGATANGTLTVTPSGGYTGTLLISVNAPASLTNFCINGNDPTVTGTTAVSSAFTVWTSAAACNSQGLTPSSRSGTGNFRFTRLPSRSVATSFPASPWKRLPIPAAALAGTLMLVCFRRRSMLIRASMAIGLALLLSFSGLAITGCSNNNSSTSTASDSPVGTYTITISAQDSVNPTITATTNFTLTVTN